MKEKVGQPCKEMDYKGLNTEQIGLICGLSKGTVGNIKARKSNIDVKSFQRFLGKCSVLNLMRLLSEEYEMLAPNISVGVLATQNNIGKTYDNTQINIFNDNTADLLSLITTKKEFIEKQQGTINTLINPLKRRKRCNTKYHIEKLEMQLVINQDVKDN